MVAVKMGRDELKIEEEEMNEEESNDHEASSSASDDDQEPSKKSQLIDSSAHTITFETVKRKKISKKKLTKRQMKEKLLAKHEREKVGFLLPDYAKDRDRENNLRRIATKGVVQLFNAVADRQKKLDEELKKKTGSKLKKSDLGEFLPERFNVKEEEDESFDSTDPDSSFKPDVSDIKREVEDSD